MEDYSVFKASPEYNEAICELFNIPMVGMISLAKERTPDFFACSKIQNNYPDSYLIKDNKNGKICSINSIGKRNVYINGKIESLMYLSDLRILPEYQRTDVRYLMYDTFYGEGRLDELSQTAVLATNKKMLKGIDKIKDRGIKYGNPYYHDVGTIISCVIPLPKRQIKVKPYQDVELRWATKEDVGSMQAYFNEEAPKRQFYPHYDFNLIGQDDYYTDQLIGDYLLAIRDNKIIGITAIWDQKKLWRTRIVGYDKKFAKIRPLFNFFNGLRNGIQLPKVNEVLKEITLHTILIKDDDVDLFTHMLRYLRNSLPRAKYDQMVVGLSEYDPCSAAFKKFSGTYIMNGKYYLVAKDEAIVAPFMGKNFYMEIARI